VTTKESDALRSSSRQAIQDQEYPTKTVLSSLLSIEDGLGWIPEEGIEEVADFIMNATINDVWAVASFYTNFRFSPPTPNTVEVCWGPSCHLVGAMGLAEKALGELGLENEGDTEDGTVTFKFNTCLGACSHAPVVAVNHKLKGKCSEERLAELLSQIRNGS
jgi:NADH:ubiquinone oxidoreductase subunit E